MCGDDDGSIPSCEGFEVCVVSSSIPPWEFSCESSTRDMEALFSFSVIEMCSVISLVCESLRESLRESGTEGMKGSLAEESTEGG